LCAHLVAFEHTDSHFTVNQITLMKESKHHLLQQLPLSRAGTLSYIHTLRRQRHDRGW